MIRQTVFGFKTEKTEETLTAHGGLALLAEYNHGIGLRTLADRHLPGPGSNRGYAVSAFVDSLVLLLQAGGRRLEDLRELRRESPLLKLVERDEIPDSDTVGDWLRRMGDPQTGRAGLLGLGTVRDILNHRLLRRDERTDYTLDMDAMQVEELEAELTAATSTKKDATNEVCVCMCKLLLMGTDGYRCWCLIIEWSCATISMEYTLRPSCFFLFLALIPCFSTNAW